MMARQTRVRTERVPVRLPDEAPTRQWMRSIRFSGFTITALALIVLFVVVLAPSLKILIDQRQQIAALEASVEASRQSVKDLKLQQDRWSDPTYIEAQARQRLSYVFPGEYSYLVQDGGTTTATANGQPISDRVQATKVDWVSTMLDSVFTAGLTQAPANELVAPVTK